MPGPSARPTAGTNRMGAEAERRTLECGATLPHPACRMAAGRLPLGAATASSPSTSPGSPGHMFDYGGRKRDLAGDRGQRPIATFKGSRHKAPRPVPHDMPRRAITLPATASRGVFLNSADGTFILARGRTSPPSAPPCALTEQRRTQVDRCRAASALKARPSGRITVRESGRGSGGSPPR